MKLNKKIILVGAAASGKDFFRDFLMKNLYKTSISHTTRPMRDGEVDGETYHFVSKEILEKKIANSEMFEHKEFNGWLYGTSIKEMRDADVFIFTPGGIKDLPEDFTNESVIVYFDIPKRERVARLLKRSDADSLDRRLMADKNDFYGFNKFDIRVSNPTYNCSRLLKEIIMHSNV